MDLDEWELIPADGLLDFRDDGAKTARLISAKSVFDMNYFDETKANRTKKPLPTTQLVPVEIPIPIQLKPPAPAPAIAEDAVSQVFFKKETEFVDMKMDSPRSPSTARGFAAQMDASAFGGFDDGADAARSEKDLAMELEGEIGEEGVNLWKLSLTGIGAICSFGVAVVCVALLGSHQSNKQRLQSHDIRFQIFEGEKRIKHVVEQSGRLNGAMSAVSRAHITFGGYYNNAL